ncbi:MAG: hypothetical protein A2045_08995 [Rhodocyclales bacterium GWA2_65_20]|nr:MAG: hypothetical protein A2045_08995 [Rhodocyclales bacterium GWA2_65_20]
MTSLRFLLLSAALAVLLQGCAGTPVVPPKIERMTAAQLEARLPQPVAVLSLEQVVVLARQGIGAGEIIARIRASGSRYRLSASRIVEMAAQGVPPEVLDHMVSAERTRIFDDMAAEAQRREQVCLQRIEQEANLYRLQTMQPMSPCWPYPMNRFP